MRVEIDPAAGVCFGVEKAVDKAEALLSEGKELYELGYMVHNRTEIERLEKLGLKTTTVGKLKELSNSLILFRAHGEPPESYKLALENNNEIIDATCPIVFKLQKKIRDTYLKIDRTQEQIVIFGKIDHPETIGLLGQIDGDAVVVTSKEDLSQIEPDKSVYLFSQTTMDPEEFFHVESALRDILVESDAKMNSSCTICAQMKKRKPSLARFAVKYESIIFVSGKNSSNGRMLFEYCRSLNKNTMWISDKRELKKDWFSEVDSVGISGATSTPLWQLESVMDSILSLTEV